MSAVTKDVLKEASRNNGLDYEDSVIYTAADYSEVDIIVTRDKKGFKESKISVLSPNEFLAFFRMR